MQVGLGGLSLRTKLACSWGHTLAISDNKPGPELKDTSSPSPHPILTALPWVQPKVSGPCVPLQVSVFGRWPSRGLYPEAPTRHAGWKWQHPRPGSYWLTSCCSVTKSCLTLCDPMDCSTPGFPILHHLLKFAQTHIYWVGVAIQQSHPALNLSQHQGLFQWVGFLHHVAKVLELQLQQQFFQWIFRVDFI